MHNFKLRGGSFPALASSLQDMGASVGRFLPPDIPYLINSPQFQLGCYPAVVSVSLYGLIKYVFDTSTTFANTFSGPNE